MSERVHVTTVFTIPGPKTATINMDFLYPADVDTSDLDDINDTAAADYALAAGLKSNFSSDIILDRIESYAYDVVARTPTPPDFRRELTLGPRTKDVNTVGTFVGTAEMPHTAVVVTFRSAASTRRTRGRVYLPPPPISATLGSTGELDSTWITNMLVDFQSYVAAIENALSGGVGVGQHVVQSLMSGSEAEVLTYTCTRRIDTQRRRLSRSLEIP